MSKTNLIALAIAAALASPAAFAVNVTPTTPDILPTNAITGNAQIVTNGAPINVTASATDNYLGRSTGYNVRVTLSGGAKFAAAVPAAAGLNGETVTIAGGGNVGDTSVTYSVVPATGVVQGDGIQIAAGDFQVNNVGFLASGTALSVDVRVGDPVGGSELASTNGTAIASAIQGWVVTYNAPAVTTSKIDVGTASGKKQFSPSGAVGGPNSTRYNAGSVSVALAPTLTNNMGLSLATATAPLKVTGADFSAFVGGTGTVTLQSVAACDGTGTTIAATVSADRTSASIPNGTTAAALNASNFVCFNANGTTIIDDQDLDASLAVAQTGFASSPSFTDTTGKLLTMAYNGAVKRVWQFNPASNMDQQSYLRITNSSGTAGLFTIDGTCDDGTAGASVTFNLGTGRSILLTSQDVENGNGAKGLTGAMGSCVANGAAGVTAKRRLVITGEVGSMEVQNFLRNGTSAGAVNTNVNNAD
jgi:hypothetical protein